MGPAVLIAAYLIGAIPFGLVLAKTVAGVDVRALGSGNIGATNVARTIGKKLGIATLLLDATKGAIPVLVARFVLHQPIEIVAGAALAAVVGHVFPIYLKFRGGKGVATSLGAFLSLTPVPTLIAAGVFGVLFAAFRMVSLGSLVAAVVLTGAVFALDGRNEVLSVTGLVLILILVRHIGNIRRLVRGTESKV